MNKRGTTIFGVCDAIRTNGKVNQLVNDEEAETAGQRPRKPAQQFLFGERNPKEFPRSAWSDPALLSKHNDPATLNKNLEGVALKNVNPSAGFLPARYVRERYHISDMTLWRWLHDDDMGFPKPVYLGRYRYWRISDIEAWEAEQEARGAA